VARKARNVLAEDAMDRTARTRSDDIESRRRRPEHHEDVWVLEEILDGDGAKRTPRAKGAPQSRAANNKTTEGTSRPSGRRGEVTLSSEIVEELAGTGGRDQASTLAERLAAAARAYDRDRYFDAKRITGKLIEQVPGSAAAQELHGLICYRLARWTEAIRHLERARAALGGDPGQIPVMMDCHRALHHHRRVEALFEELKAASPSADVLVEGRLVMAADMADQHRLQPAIDLLVSTGGARHLRHPGDRHVRQWYVLGDLYERAGDLPRARELFTRVAQADPELADAAERLAGLGRNARRKPSPGTKARRPSPRPAPEALQARR
jgi:tetratricopeptide (TPR) repeat protein